MLWRAHIQANRAARLMRCLSRSALYSGISHTGFRGRSLPHIPQSASFIPDSRNVKSWSYDFETIDNLFAARVRRMCPGELEGSLQRVSNLRSHFVGQSFSSHSGLVL